MAHNTSMLTRAENEPINGVGPGTPMGALPPGRGQPALSSGERVADGDHARVVLGRRQVGLLCHLGRYPKAGQAQQAARWVPR